MRLDAGRGGIDWHLRHAPLPRRDAQLRPGRLRIGSLRVGASPAAHSRLDGVSLNAHQT